MQSSDQLLMDFVKMRYQVDTTLLCFRRRHRHHARKGQASPWTDPQSATIDTRRRKDFAVQLAGSNRTAEVSAQKVDSHGIVGYHIPEVRLVAERLAQNRCQFLSFRRFQPECCTGGVFRVTQTATSFSSHFFSIPGPALPVSRTSPDSIDMLNEIYSVH